MVTMDKLHDVAKYTGSADFFLMPNFDGPSTWYLGIINHSSALSTLKQL